MNDHSLILIKSMMQKNPALSTQAFPPIIGEKLAEIPSSFCVSMPSILSYQFWMKKVHYSWFFPFLKTLPSHLQAIYLAILPKQKREKLAAMLQVKPRSTKPPFFLQIFLIATLKKELHCDHHLDLPDLTPSKLDTLLTMSKQKLFALISLLGIYDLAIETKVIVNKDFYKKILTCLEPQQRQYLDYCQKQSVKWYPQKLDLSQWDQKHSSLQHLIHKRGLGHLGRALSHESASFNWRFTHLLDTGRAGVIQSSIDKNIQKHLSDYFQSQILYILKRYIP